MFNNPSNTQCHGVQLCQKPQAFRFPRNIVVEAFSGESKMLSKISYSPFSNVLANQQGAYNTSQPELFIRCNRGAKAVDNQNA